MSRDPADVNPLWTAASAEYREQHPLRGEAPDWPNGSDPPPKLPVITASTFARFPKPERRFLDAQRIFPMKNVAMLSGDGGVGKSWLALQLAIAVAAGAPWVDIEVRQGGAVYLSAEDDCEETHARLYDICAAEGIDMADLTSLKFSLLAGHDAVLAVEDARGSRMRATGIYQGLERLLGEEKPELLVLDNLADVFSGNENSRPLAKQFVGMLRHLAIEHECVVLLLGHPSLSGLASGTGMSGSTAWNNSVRVRLYLHHVKNGEGKVIDDSLRELETMKVNYSAKGQPIGLQWQNGRFMRKDVPKPFDDVTLEHLETVRSAFRKTAYRVSELSDDWGGYAVANIIGVDVGRGIAKAERTVEQENARANVRTILATWVRNRQLSVVDMKDETRRTRQFYGVPDDA
jgi:hypothetical protein